MNLPEVLKALGDEMPGRAHWIVAILTRRNESGEVLDEVLEYPIFDISIDSDDSEINLICDQGSKSPRPADTALTLGVLLDRLRQLETECGNYNVFSGSAFVSIDDDYEARYDAPLVGVACNTESEIYGFLQYPPDQWEWTS